MPARPNHVARLLACLLEHLESPRQSDLLGFRHRCSALGAAAPREESLTCYPSVRNSHYDLGYFDDETCRLEPIANPFGPKVLPMSPE
jgi:hypothetical protein